MPGETPRLGLGTYAQGDEWDHTDTVEALDEKAIERGPIAERPATGDYDDELYHATDQNITWRWDNTAGDWNPLNTGTSENPVPGTSHFEAASIEKINNIVYIDPNTSDWGAAVNTALQEISPAGTIVTPPGHYTTNETVLVDDRVALVTAGFIGNRFGPPDEGSVRITRGSDIPFIESTAPMAINGFDFLGSDDDTDTSDAIVCHDKIRSQGNSGLWLGDGSLFFLEMRDGMGDNLNHSRIVDAEGKRCHSIVKTANNAGTAPDLNACYFQVTHALDCWAAIDAPAGFGNHYVVHNAEGGTGGVVITARNTVELPYAEDLDWLIDENSDYNIISYNLTTGVGSIFRDGANSSLIIQNGEGSGPHLEVGWGHLELGNLRVLDSEIRFGDYRLNVTGWGHLEFINDDGTKIAQLYENGDMEIAGALTENTTF